jgi:hypothetical protein
MTSLKALRNGLRRKPEPQAGTTFSSEETLYLVQAYE